MSMTLEQGQEVIVQALSEFLDPNLPKVVIVNGPRAELRGVPNGQVKAIGQAWGLISEALKRRDGKMPIAMPPHRLPMTETRAHETKVTKEFKDNPSRT